MNSIYSSRHYLNSSCLFSGVVDACGRASVHRDRNTGSVHCAQLVGEISVQVSLLKLFLGQVSESDVNILKK
jgi:hypothetical protein